MTGDAQGSVGVKCQPERAFSAAFSLPCSPAEGLITLTVAGFRRYSSSASGYTPIIEA
jgi:hypothetical protein